MFIAAVICAQAITLGKHDDQPKGIGKMRFMRGRARRFLCSYPFITAAACIKCFFLWLCSLSYMCFHFCILYGHKMPRLLIGSRWRTPCGRSRIFNNCLGYRPIIIMPHRMTRFHKLKKRYTCRFLRLYHLSVYNLAIG